MALVDMSVVEQRYRAVLAVLAGGSVTEVAREVGVARQTLSGWVSRYRESGLGGLVDRSRRPHSSPSQMGARVEVLVCELRRQHPRWGPVRLAHEAGRRGVDPPPSRMGVYRAPGEVLTDNGKQFTVRFGHGGEVLFDRICRDNAVDA